MITGTIRITPVIPRAGSGGPFTKSVHYTRCTNGIVMTVAGGENGLGMWPWSIRALWERSGALVTPYPNRAASSLVLRWV